MPFVSVHGFPIRLHESQPHFRAQIPRIGLALPSLRLHGSPGKGHGTVPVAMFGSFVRFPLYAHTYRETKTTKKTTSVLRCKCAAERGQPCFVRAAGLTLQMDGAAVTGVQLKQPRGTQKCARTYTWHGVRIVPTVHSSHGDGLTTQFRGG